MRCRALSIVVDWSPDPMCLSGSCCAPAAGPRQPCATRASKHPLYVPTNFEQFEKIMSISSDLVRRIYRARICTGPDRTSRPVSKLQT